jgi:hypothetical protein
MRLNNCRRRKTVEVIFGRMLEFFWSAGAGESGREKGLPAGPSGEPSLLKSSFNFFGKLLGEDAPFSSPSIRILREQEPVYE